MPTCFIDFPLSRTEPVMWVVEPFKVRQKAGVLPTPCPEGDGLWTASSPKYPLTSPHLRHGHTGMAGQRWQFSSGPISFSLWQYLLGQTKLQSEAFTMSQWFSTAKIYFSLMFHLPHCGLSPKQWPRDDGWRLHHWKHTAFLNSLGGKERFWRNL